MASFNRGQLPARQTKVVHHRPGWIKAGTIRGVNMNCRYDAVSSKPIMGRDIVDVPQSLRVSKCGSDRCKTCVHMIQGDSFISNTTNNKYNIVSPVDMDCGSKNVIYLITCAKCGIQYVGKTSQTLRCRVNNHRNRLKQVCDLYLYNHFNSDGHTIADLQIMPIEEVSLKASDNVTLASKLLNREEYWIKEIGCLYPYGLNDNIRQLGNISDKLGQGLIVYSLFNKHNRKYRKRSGRRRKNKMCSQQIIGEVQQILKTYLSPEFGINIRTYLHSVPRRKMREVLNITEGLLLNSIIPSRVALLVRDFVSYRNRVQVKLNDTINKDCMNKRNYLKIFFHNKGIDMINLPTILHSKRVIATIPNYLDATPPIVSYTYPRTIASRVFNFKQVIKELNFEVGTSQMKCNCSVSPYRYTPAGHVVTGNLNIINNRQVRKLLMKGPKYGEQNNINWRKNEELCNY